MFKNIDVNDDNLKEIGIDKLVQEAVKVKYENDELKILQTIIKEQQKELEDYKTEHKIMKRILVEHNLWETLINDDEFIEYLTESVRKEMENDK